MDEFEAERANDMERLTQEACEKSFSIYCSGMKAQLPCCDDNVLYGCHQFWKSKAIEFYKSNSNTDIENLIVKIEQSFSSLLDLNWSECEEFCRGTLDELKKTYSLASSNGLDYWNAMRSLRAQYGDSVGDTLDKKMMHVWLEYLYERRPQDVDSLFRIIHPEEQNLQDRESCSELNRQKLLLELQSTWGRFSIAANHWISCRNETLEFLYESLSTFEEKNIRFEREESDLSDVSGFAFCEQLTLKFTSISKRDDLCHRLLLAKLKETIETFECRKYTDVWETSAKRLLETIASFRTDVKTKQIGRSDVYAKCHEIITQSQTGTTHALEAGTKELFHYPKYFQLEQGEKGAVTITLRNSIRNLTLQRDKMKALISVTELNLKTLVSDVKDDLRKLEFLVPIWIRRRNDIIRTLGRIKDKLHAVERGTAIAQTVGSSVGLLGGAVGLAGLVLAPFTAGLSLLPTAVAGGLATGAGTLTGLTAMAVEMGTAKTQMEKAAELLELDSSLSEDIVSLMDSVKSKSLLLMRYFPQDEFDPMVEATRTSSFERGSVGVSPPTSRLAFTAVRTVSLGGNAAVLSIAKSLLAGTATGASRAALQVFSHGIVAVGMALDAANLALAVRNLSGEGRNSLNVKGLEDILEKLEKERDSVVNFSNAVLNAETS